MTADEPLFDEEHQAAFGAVAVYDKLKALESQMPVPPTWSTVTVGTLDSTTGTFTGYRSTTETYVDDWGKPHTITEAPIATIDGVNASLVFSCGPRPKLGQTTFQVIVDGQTFAADSTSPSKITVDVRTRKRVTWTMKCDGKTASDTLAIDRPKANGVGALQVTALPISLLYEPPQNAAKTNYARYTTTLQRAAAISFAGTQTSSTTRALPAMPPTFDRIYTVAQKLDLLKAAVPEFAAKLSDIKSALGSVSTDVTNSQTVSNENTLEYSTQTTASQTTNARLGPGRGDIIGYLRSARFMWTMVDGEVALTLIDADVEVYRAMADVVADHAWLASQPTGTLGPVTGLDRPTLESLIALDPFTSNVWDPNRFEFIKSISPAGTIESGLCRTYKETDKTTSSKTRTTVMDIKTGWLGTFLGIEAGKNTTTVTQSSSRSTTVGTSVCAAFSLAAAPGEAYTVDVYYDKQFGTFAFRQAP